MGGDESPLPLNSGHISKLVGQCYKFFENNGSYPNWFQCQEEICAPRNATIAMPKSKDAVVLCFMSTPGQRSGRVDKIAILLW